MVNPDNHNNYETRKEFEMNYIVINDKRIDLTDEQIKEIKGCLDSDTVRLSDIAVGDVCEIGGNEFVVLEHFEDTTAVILKGLFSDKEKFGERNNYENSNVDVLCEDFGKRLSSIVGEDNLIEHTVDLTANDGLKCYGIIKRKVSLLTADLYRRYVYILDKYKVDKWWWLATPWSTKFHEDEDCVLCVSPRGSVDYDDSNDYGVRPFCILNSNIFVSQ